jgi:hypothetical protein
VNGDGAYTDGVDAVDLDGDGRAGDGEVLHTPAATFSRAGSGSGPAATELRPDRDWPYVDTNGDGQRPGRSFGDARRPWAADLRGRRRERRWAPRSASGDRLGRRTSRASIPTRNTASGSGRFTAQRARSRRRQEAFASMMHGTAVGGHGGQRAEPPRWTARARGRTRHGQLRGPKEAQRRRFAAVGHRSGANAADRICAIRVVSMDGSSKTVSDAALAKGVPAVSPAGNLAEGPLRR